MLWNDAGIDVSDLDTPITELNSLIIDYEERISSNQKKENFAVPTDFMTSKKYL